MRVLPLIRARQSNCSESPKASCTVLGWRHLWTRFCSTGVTIRWLWGASSRAVKPVQPRTDWPGGLLPGRGCSPLSGSPSGYELCTRCADVGSPERRPCLPLRAVGISRVGRVDRGRWPAPRDQRPRTKSAPRDPRPRATPPRSRRPGHSAAGPRP
jgi:hypothetical protein